MNSRLRPLRALWALTASILLSCHVASAQERLCDPSLDDCYAPLLKAIQSENTGIDFAFYFIGLPEVADAIIKRFQAGVPVRLTVEPRANLKFPDNQILLDKFKAAGIPMRYKAGDGILHAKMLLLAGQNKVIFSSSNFGDADVRPYAPLENYVDGAWYFCDDPAVVNSFKTHYDDIWTNTTLYGDFANINGTVSRKYPTSAFDSAVNFLPNPSYAEDYSTRTIAQIDLENRQIDLTMYRLTDARICDALLRAVARGVTVRLLAEPHEYRFDPSRAGAEFTNAYNVDRLYAAGAQIKMRKHLGLTHQKSLTLYGRGLTIFGSSNWSWQSFNYQEEHNYFTTKPWFFQWFVDQFNRKWNSASEFQPFVPLPPGVPVNLAPANGVTTGQSVMITWEGGGWANKYDVYLGRSADTLSLIASDVVTGTLGPAAPETYVVSGLQNGATYCWQVVGKTMANQTTAGPTWCFNASSAIASAVLPPAPMQLLLDSAGPAIDQVASLDSLLLFRDPFRVVNQAALLNQQTDRNTRLIVFVKNLHLASAELPSAVTVNLVDGLAQSFDIPAETVQSVASTDFVQVVFRLPDNLAPGKCVIMVKAHGQLSNRGSITITG